MRSARLGLGEDPAAAQAAEAVDLGQAVGGDEHVAEVDSAAPRRDGGVEIDLVDQHAWRRRGPPARRPRAASSSPARLPLGIVEVGEDDQPRALASWPLRLSPDRAGTRSPACVRTGECRRRGSARRRASARRSGCSTSTSSPGAISAAMASKLAIEVPSAATTCSAVTPYARGDRSRAAAGSGDGSRHRDRGRRRSSGSRSMRKCGTSLPVRA